MRWILLHVGVDVTNDIWVCDNMIKGLVVISQLILALGVAKLNIVSTFAVIFLLYNC